MQDYLFIFLGTQAIIFILRCLTAKIFILKKTASPPPPINCTSPIKKRDQFQPFPNSTDCHTKHIAVLHGLWPTKHLYTCNVRVYTRIVARNCPWRGNKSKTRGQGTALGAQYIPQTGPTGGGGGGWKNPPKLTEILKEWKKFYIKKF